jgi:hypothetical protein
MTRNKFLPLFRLPMTREAHLVKDLNRIQDPGILSASFITHYILHFVNRNCIGRIFVGDLFCCAAAAATETALAAIVPLLLDHVLMQTLPC